MKKKDKKPDEMRMPASDFDRMMRGALGAAPQTEPKKTAPADQKAAKSDEPKK